MPRTIRFHLDENCHQALVLIWELMDPEEMANRVEYL